MRPIGPLLLLWSRFKSEARMVWAMLRDPAAPFVSKALAVAALVYLVFPVDFVSDLVPLVGWIDDGAVLVALLWLAYRLLPRDVYDALRRRTAPAREPIDGEARRVG